MTMNSDLPTYNSERTEGLAWLRDVLSAMLEVSPVSYQQKKKTAPLLQRMPDWLMASWTESLNIDCIGGCQHGRKAGMRPGMVGLYRRRHGFCRKSQRDIE